MEEIEYAQTERGKLIDEATARDEAHASFLAEFGPHHFDRAGKAISNGRWAELFEDDNYRLLAEHRDSHGWIQTVWTGIASLLFGMNSRAVFETIVQYHNRAAVLDKYITEAEAMLGHAHFLEQYKNGQLFDDKEDGS